MSGSIAHKTSAVLFSGSLEMKSFVHVSAFIPKARCRETSQVTFQCQCTRVH